MSLLHTVNKSPFTHESLSDCLRYAQAGSAILLIEDGVYAAREGNQFTSRIKDALKDKKIYALEPDLKARGMADQLIAGIALVDYAGFVDLTTEASTVQSWL